MVGTQDDELFVDLVDNRDQSENVLACAKVSDCDDDDDDIGDWVYDDNLTSEEFYELSVKAMMRISRDFKMTDTINYKRNMFEIVMAN
ncbi:hypothetical protein DPMN_028247 [Dreissena polymorpha]|uniref:Uncharacterized protein n=1 Tax=Dreissena polymorpha TaxID=45954 RepID=A0A9D4LV41_DREPO|nr:hypothetical protein DPMN_028247 [Dreissena polymorpha]